MPFSLTSRLLSVRAFDADDMRIDAVVLEGEGLSARRETWFERAEVAYVHMHNARRGCYAARATRAG